MNSNINSKNIILYGGAFNPPTIAHIQILEACIEYANSIKAEVWLIPSGQRPDKSIATDPKTRLELVDAYLHDTQGGSTVKVDRFELEQEGLLETFITKRYLQENYPEHKFTWVFGADSITTMKEWTDGEKLWEELDMLVTRRQGYGLLEMPPKARILEVETVTTSSTIVRGLIEKGEDYSHLVSKSVYTTLQSMIKETS